MSSVKYSLLAALAPMLAAPAHAIVIEFDPLARTVPVGDAFDVDIVLGGLDAAGETVSAFDLFIGYDPAIIAPAAVAFGPGPDVIFAADAAFALGVTFDLGSAILGTFGLDSPGPFSISAGSLMPPLPAMQDDSILLATLTFEALATGSTSLSLLDHPVAGSPLNVSGNDPGAFLVFDRIGSGVVRVGPTVGVPAPGTLALFAVGLLLVATARLGRRS